MPDDKNLVIAKAISPQGSRKSWAWTDCRPCKGSGQSDGGPTWPRCSICDGQGVRLLKIHPRCKNLIRELQTYRYDERSRSVEAGEPKPLKLDDHGPDALRYLLWNFR